MDGNLFGGRTGYRDGWTHWEVARTSCLWEGRAIGLGLVLVRWELKITKEIP